ncbi:MAG: lipoprotein [Hydrocarboniphaga sp.]|uniref:DUF2958 domain-containing protein n=1 Tax=Hydrocarboniphaga sp. TaxID=2033016 RepID=UPI00260E169B|nr:DUF2958 domain-containing protein [Hydrocarboniphaga sp.]MDB5971125.1 lipoprotein [Hydrocarboniphaga sp.]
MIMTLLTDEQRQQLLANGALTARGEPHDPVPVVKLYTPDAHATWLLTELDPRDGDTAYGLCDAGLGNPELAHVRISDLESIRGPLEHRVVRDLHFKPSSTLSEYVRLAQSDGSIND